MLVRTGVFDIIAGIICLGCWRLSGFWIIGLGPGMNLNFNRGSAGRSTWWSARRHGPGRTGPTRRSGLAGQKRQISGT